MKLGSIILIVLCIILMNSTYYAQTPKELAESWDRYHISFLPPKNLKHAHLKIYLMSLKNLGLKVEEVGRSYENREIYQVEWGKGKTKILMWSQMHGNEPTATSALLDMLTFLQKNKEVEWVKKLEETVTIHVVPMLNPDGTEIYQRRNAQSIDINRDALALETPEARILKKLRDDWKPDIGFNLHNQSPFTTAGDTKKQVAIALLAVLGNAKGTTNEGHERNKRICGIMVKALNQFIEGHIGRYDEDYNPLAFGDLFSAGGTPVILIETGGLQEKETEDPLYLVKINFIAYLVSLNSLADGSEKQADPNIYENIPLNNSGNLFSIIFRNATIINFVAKSTIDNSDEKTESFTADVAINAERRSTGEISSTIIRDIGDLSTAKGIKEFDVAEFYLVSKNGNLDLGKSDELLFYKKERKIDWTSENLIKNYKPDAVFSNGKWTKPLK